MSKFIFRLTFKFVLFFALFISVFSAITYIFAEDLTETTQTENSDTNTNIGYFPSKLSEQLNDPTNLLGENHDSVVTMLSDVYKEVNEKIYVVLVPIFEGETTAEAWIQETVNLTEPTANSVIFALAYDSQLMAIYVPKDSEALTQSQMNTTLTKIETEVSQKNWVSAINVLADSVLTSTEVKEQNWFWIYFTIIVVVVLVAILCVIYFIYLPKKRSHLKKHKRIRGKNILRGHFDHTSKHHKKIENVTDVFLASDKIELGSSNSDNSDYQSSESNQL